MISIITITFNNFEELLETIASIKPALNEKNELIVINGGTCESTKKFLENEYQGKYISEKDNGIADAFNKGVKNASGEYICYINSGDKLIDANYFNEIQKELEKDIDIVCCDNKHQVDGVGEVYKKCVLNFPNMPFNHQGLLVKKSLMEKVGLFDESFKIAMDFDLIAKIYALKTPSYFYYKKPVVLMDGNGISHLRNDIGQMEKLRSLKQNGLLTSKHKTQLYYQYGKAKIKLLLQSVGLNGLVNHYKKIISKA